MALTKNFGGILLGIVSCVIGANGVTAEMWSPTGSMQVKRVLPTATILANGQVLVVGGAADATHFGQVASLTTAELYSPTTGAFSYTAGAMATGRVNHTATRLSDGRVLIAGGTTATANVTSLASAELYDPTSNSFSPVPQSMVVARSGHAAALLPDGTVLLAGGVDTPTNGTSIASAEIYNPSNNSFTLISPMTAARRYITSSGEAIRRSDGSVLIAGGVGAGQAILNNADLYGTTGFSATGPMSHPRFLHAAALLQNGEVLVTGGVSPGGILSTADLFAVGGSFSPTTGSMTTARSAHTATQLPDGQVLIVGGNNDSGFLASAERYNASTKSFAGTASMAAARRSHIAVLLPTGDVLVAGGENASTGLASAELYGNPPIIVTIDIKPGSYPNSINLSAAGVIPVAIFSSPTFDAPAEIDPESLTLAGARVKVAGKSDKSLCHSEDSNRDGRLDLVCQFENELNAQVGDSIAILEGQTYTNVHIQGQDSIRIVPD